MDGTATDCQTRPAWKCKPRMSPVLLPQGNFLYRIRWCLLPSWLPRLSWQLAIVTVLLRPASSIRTLSPPVSSFLSSLQPILKTSNTGKRAMISSIPFYPSSYIHINLSSFTASTNHARNSYSSRARKHSAAEMYKRRNQ